MNSLERIRTVLNLGQPDRAPFSFKLSPAQIDRAEAELGTRDFKTYFDFDIKQGQPAETKLSTDFTVFHDNAGQPNSRLDEWGVLHVPTPDSYHFARRCNPMAKFDSAEQFASYPYPDFDAEYRY